MNNYPDDVYTTRGKKFWLDYNGPLNDDSFKESRIEDYQRINNIMK